MRLSDIAAKIYHFFIYEHERVGYNGKPFQMYKFRTMVQNADDLLEKVEKTNGRNERGVIIDDPRRKRFGESLSKYRIDELPQLINILKGEMAVMGPRAHSPDYIQRFIPEDLQKTRKQQKPGWLKPKMAFCDYDYSDLEWVTERKYLDELKVHPWLTKITYTIRALMPTPLKWQLYDTSKIYGRKEFYAMRKSPNLAKQYQQTT